MSIVRYTNKKTGVVTLYESTSHYDPATKQSRPVRKYLGIEDPETGELIPSSGKRGRKKTSDTGGGQNRQKNEETDYRLLWEKQKKECQEKDAVIRKLEHRNKILRTNLERIQTMISDMLEE